MAVLHFGLALLSLAFGLAVPVFLVNTVHLPTWIPGTVLAVNAAPGALGAAPVGAAITGHAGNAPRASKEALREY